MALDINQLKSFQTGSKTITQTTTTVVPGISNVTGSSSLQKTIQSISQLSSKSNEISSFLNDAGIASGNQPFSLVKFAREFILKQNKETSENNKTPNIQDPNPAKTKVDEITKKVVDNIVQNYLQSGRLLNILENNINKILKQNNVNYVTIENGQIVAQPIQNEQVNKAIENIQKTVDTYVLTVDKYVRRVYNTDPIRTVEDFKKNLSINKVIDFNQKIIAIQIEILLLKIKIRKAKDTAIAANAAAQVPVPNLSLAAEYTERALGFTAEEKLEFIKLYEQQLTNEKKQKKIKFYGEKYEKRKNQLLNLKQTIDTFQSNVFNKALTNVNNQLTGSYNKFTESLETRLNNITGSR